MFAWLRRARARLRYRKFDDDLRRELEIHRELKEEELRAVGLPADQAQRRAARDLGNVVLMREAARGIWIAPWLQSAAQDLRYARRVLRRQPAFSLGAVLLLSLGIGLVTAVFSFAYATMLRPWRVPDPASVVLIRPRPTLPSQPDAPTSRRLPEFGGISLAEVRHFQSQPRAFGEVFALMSSGVRVRGGPPDNAVNAVRAAYVTGNYFTALRSSLAGGRGFVPAEDEYRTPAAVALISDRLWRLVFHRDPGVVGREIEVAGHPFAIVGVTAEGFTDPIEPFTDVWMPMAAQAILSPDRLAVFDDPRAQMGVLPDVAGRLAPSVTEAQAEAELTRLSQEFRAARELPIVSMNAMNTRPITRTGIRDWQRVTVLLLAAMLLVLFVACANVGNLILARALSRRGELAVRLSLGAGRARVVRQLVAETGLLSLVAGAVGLGIAWLVPGLVLPFIDDWPEPPEFYAPDMTVFGFALGLAVVTALACGLPPALRATRVSLASAMSERHGQTVSAARLRRALLATQVALATVLLTCAGLLTRAVDHAMDLDPGFAVDEVQILEVEAPGRLPREQWRSFRRALGSTVRRAGLPPVAFAERPPLEDTNYVMMVRTGHVTDYAVLARGVSENYFDVLGIRLLTGRVPNDAERTLEIVVNDAAARRLWPGEEPVGQTLVDTMGSNAGTTFTVVGVVAAVPVRSVTDLEPVIYRGLNAYSAVLLVRDRSPATVETIRRLASRIEPGITLRARPLRENVRDSLAVPIAASRVAQAIGALALMLAMFGTFGVFAFAVEERRREIGLRLALGARGPDVMRAMLAANGWSLGGGVAAGLLLAVVGALLLRGYLYGLSPLDPIAYLGVTAVLGFSAAMATLLPTRRAARIDPAVTLRSE